MSGTQNEHNSTSTGYTPNYTPLNIINASADGISEAVKAFFKDIDITKDFDKTLLRDALRGVGDKIGKVSSVPEIMDALNSSNPNYEVTKKLTQMFGSQAVAAAVGGLTVAFGGLITLSPAALAFLVFATAGFASFYGDKYIGIIFDKLFKDGGVFDNYTRPFYTISDETEYEGETMVFKLRFKETPKSPVTINFKTIGYTATENDDFEYKNETLTISPDDIKNGVYEYKVKIHNDSEFDEGKEYFVLRTELMNKDNFPNLVQDFYIEEDVPFIVHGQGNILDKGKLHATISDISVNEADGKAVFTLSIDRAVDEDLVFYATTMSGKNKNIDAIADKDYVSFNDKKVIIYAGDTSASIEVDITNDEFNENDEKFGLWVSPDNQAQTYGLETLYTATATIIDDDKNNITIRFYNDSSNEGNNETESKQCKVSVIGLETLSPNQRVEVIISSPQGIQTLTFTPNGNDTQEFTYYWSGNEIPQEDREEIIDGVGCLITTDEDGNESTTYLNVDSALFSIKDDDDDPDNPNDTFPDTDPASTKTSPIVIDLNGDGVKTISRKNNKIYFDLDNNKFAQNTAWIDSNDGILINKALITDNNITNGSQLFGNHTLLTNGNLATNGFEALKEFDENNDGVINELDQNAYENLAIWQDVNSNAKLDVNELKSLKELGIKEISLNYTNSNFTDENGNEHRQTSSVVFENGNKANISDVWLDNHTADTKYVGEKIALSNEIRALPQVYAFGEVLNLRQAMAQDEVLKTMVQSYIVADKATQNEMINDIIYRWANSDQIDPNSRDPKQVYSHVMDARMLVALEHLTGKGYLGTWCWGEKDPNPHGQAAPLLIAEFNKFAAYTQAQISAQSKYKDLFADILPLQWKENQTGNLSVAFGVLKDEIASLLSNSDYTLISIDDIMQVRDLIKVVKNLGTYNTKYQSVFKTIESEWLSEIENLKFVLNSVEGTDGNDSLSGDNKDNVIIGGRGDDTLFGGNGNDMYYFDIVFGKDRVYDSAGIDSIVFSENVKPENIELTRNKTSIYITRLDDNGAKTNDIIQIDNFFEYNGDIGNGAIEKIIFQNGTQWDINKIIENLAPQPTQGNDNLYGDMKDNILSGLDGDDTIYGGNGNDTINGDDGDDTLYGDNGNDIINGGKGNDTLDGGNGNDVYIYNLGDGADTIADYYGSNAIKFGEGISKDDIIVTRINSDDLKLSFKDNQTDSIILKSGAYYSIIENIEFVSGEILKLSDLVADVTGTDTNDTLYAFGNTVNGLDGNDTIYGSDKADTIIGGKGNDNLNGGNGSDTLSGNDGDDKLYGGNGNDTLNGGAGNDTIYGDYGDDSIIGGTGNDSLNGGYGNDTYIFSKGDGVDTISDYGGNDTIKFNDFNQDDIELKRELTSLVITSKISDDKIVIQNFFDTNANTSNPIEKIIFKDNSEWNLNQILENAPLIGTDGNDKLYLTPNNDEFNALGGDDTIHAGNGNDTINAGSGNDTVYAGNGDDNVGGDDGDDTLYADNGDDTLSGGTGNDKLYGGYGNDTYIYNLGDGDDTIEDVGGSETIKFGEGISKDDLIVQKVNNSNLKISFKNSSGSLMLNYAISNNNYAIENFEFANGDKLTFNDIKALSLIGSDENDTITGYNDMGGVIIGGKGNDTLKGGNKDEVYRYNLGDGDDTITEQGGNNIIEFGDGISKSDISVIRHNNGLKIFINNENNQGSITITNNVSMAEVSLVPISEIKFANGETLSFEELRKLSLIGSDSNETISGYSDMDNFIDGKAGNDTIYGGNKNDTLIGSLGNDSLNGGNGDDVYIYNKGDGNDTILDNAGNDVIEFGEGISKDDIIISTLNNSGSLKISFKNDDGSITFNTAIENIKFANSETLNLEEIKTLSLIGRDSNDKIYGFANRDNEIQGNAGDDELNGNNANDTLIGSLGNDNLQGGYGDDTYIFNLGDGNDTITDTAGSDTIKFGEGINKDDLIVTRVNSQGNADTNASNLTDLLIKFKGNESDSIILKSVISANKTNLNFVIENFKFANGETLSFADIKALSLIGSDNNETIIAYTDENNQILANAGDDTITGSVNADTINAGSGNDTINAGNGDNTIYAGDGDDSINTGSGKDSIDAGAGNDSINAGDGDDIIDGGDGNDNINAGNGDDTLIGSLGNDTLNGGNGDDVYIFNIGDGIDTITDTQGIDTIKFGQGISKDMLIARRDTNNPANLIISIKNTDDSISINNFYVKNSNGAYVDTHKDLIEFFEFSDGTKLTYREFEEQIVFIGTNESDNIQGTNLADSIKGNDGDDSLYGRDGDDTINGNEGNDTIYADNGDDTINGGKGNDSLNGGNGNDTYIFNIGDGKDIIYDVAGTDTIEFGSGISKEDLIITRVNSQGNADTNASNLTDLLIKFKNNETDSIILKSVISKNATNPNFVIENFKFANGETLSFADIKALSLIGSDNDETIIAYADENNQILANAGDDTITGSVNADTINAGSGNDVINAGNGDNIIDAGDGDDTINTGSGKDSISAGSGNDTISAGAGNDTINAEAGDDTVHAGAGDDIVNGNDGNDTIYADDGDDTINGGKGNDSLYGGYGNDTYIFNIGDGEDIINDYSGADKIKFGQGISKDDLIVQRVNSNGQSDTNTSNLTDLKISFKNSVNDSITLKSVISHNKTNLAYLIESFEFANGETLSFQDIKNLSLIGLDNSDTIIAYSDENNQIHANGGDDTITGSSNADTINAGSGDDSINSGKGDDTIYAGDGNDNIDSGEGDDNIDAGSGDDTIYAGNGNDTIIGGKGDDNIDGGYGDDVYIFNIGDGADTINDYNGVDKIKFGEGISKDDLIITRLENKDSSYDDLKISFKNSPNDSIILKNIISTNYDKTSFSTNSSNAIENFEFASGETLSLEDIKNLSLVTGDNNDTIYAYKDQDSIIFANGGNDTIHADSKNDTINAGSGDDAVYANAGDDTIIGGTGNDSLNGGDGNDTYIYNIGDGNDTITEQNGADKIKFGVGINKEDIIVTKIGDNSTSNDIKISFKNSANDSITLKGVINNGNTYERSVVETLEFANGDKLTFDELKLLSLNNKTSNDEFEGYNDINNTLIGSNLADIIKGGGLNDTITGSLGDDSLQGGEGSDTYIYNLGDGADIINEFNHSYNTTDIDTIVFGEGISKEDLIVYRELDSTNTNTNLSFNQMHSNLNNLVIKFKNSANDSITIKNAIASGAINSLNTLKTFKFANGEELNINDIANLAMKGQDGDDTIYAFSNENFIINAGLGNDIIHGSTNNEIYEFDLGHGNDIIIERDLSTPNLIVSDSYDIIRFTAGINKEDIKFCFVGDDLLIKNEKSNDSITIKKYFNASNNTYKINKIEFANGEFLTSTDIENSAIKFGSDEKESISGYKDSNDHIFALGGDDSVFGFKGDDYIDGGDGNDYLSGGNGIDSNTGNDTLVGGNGDDTLRGEDGDDTLSGGSGNNKYLYESGNDTIILSSDANDILFLQNGVSKDDLIFTISENKQDLIIKFKDNNQDSVVVKDYFSYKNLRIQPNSGYLMPYNEIESLFKDELGLNNPNQGDNTGSNTGNETGNSGSNNPSGNGDNTGGGSNGGNESGDSSGGTGGDTPSNPTPQSGIIKGDDSLNDTLYGDNSDNTFVFTKGSDTIIDKGGYDKLIFKDGITFSQIGNYIMSNGKDLILRLDGSNENKVTIKDFFVDPNAIIEEFVFETGGSISANQIYSLYGLEFPKEKIKTDPSKLSYQDINLNNYNNTLSLSGGNYSISDEGGDDTIILKGFKKEDISFQKIARDLSIRYGDDNYLMIRNQDNQANKIETIKLVDNNNNGAGYITSSQIDKIIEQLNTYASDNGLTTITHDDIASNQNLMQIVMSGWN